MRSKWKTYFIHIFLVTLVAFNFLGMYLAISPDLPFFNWMESVQNMTQKFFSKDEQKEEQRAEAVRLSVYFPTSMIWRGEGNTQMTQGRDVLSKGFKALLDSFPDRPDIRPLSQEDSLFIQESGQDFIELNFGEGTPFNLIGDKNYGDFKNTKIKSLRYTLDTDHVWAIPAQGNTVYRLELKDKKPKINEILKDDKAKWQSVMMKRLKNEVVAIPVGKIEIPTISYIMERQSNSHYLQLLFPSDESIHDYSDNEISRYYANRNSLVIDNGSFQSTFTYESQMSTDDYVEALKQLSMIESNTSSWRYIGTNPTTKEFEFRRYSQNYPIYGENDVALIKVKPGDPMNQLTFSALDIQTSITNFSENWELPSGDKVLKTLNDYGFGNNEIENLSLGYFWRLSPDSNRMVQLVPSWMVRIDGKDYLLETVLPLNDNVELKSVETKTNEEVTIGGIDHPVEQQSLPVIVS